MRYVIEVEKGPPTAELQRLLVESVSRETVETMMSWAQQLREEGREEGLAVARKLARRVLVRLMAKRFGSVSDAVAATIENGSLEQLEAWTDRLLVVESAEQVVSE